MATTLCLSSIQASSAADPLPKIILVMADDQGWGDTAYNGHPFVPTPALNTMAIGLNFFDNDPYLSRNGKVEKRSKPLGFWHKFQDGQSTWSDRIQKAIMEKPQAGAPLPHDPPRMRKDVDAFPEFPEASAKGHAAWNDWPWKLHRISGKTFELYNLADDPIEKRIALLIPINRFGFVAGSTKRTPIATRSDALGLP